MQKHFKWKTFLLILTIVFSLSSTLLAFHDYSNIKGDFKVFCLGDSEEESYSKLEYLTQIEGIKPEYSPLDNVKVFQTSAFGFPANCQLGFYRNKLYVIVVSIYESEEKLMSITNNKIVPFFIERYGKDPQDIEPTKSDYYTYLFCSR